VSSHPYAQWAVDFVRHLAESDPNAYDSEHGPRCWFCGGDDIGCYPENAVEHSYECEWVLARWFFGLRPLPERHVLVKLGPPQPPLHGPWPPMGRRPIFDALPTFPVERGGISIIKPPDLATFININPHHEEQPHG
jgi:hypothetical protein